MSVGNAMLHILNVGTAPFAGRHRRFRGFPQLLSAALTLKGRRRDPHAQIPFAARLVFEIQIIAADTLAAIIALG
jgi:hypothetical protein